MAVATSENAIRASRPARVFIYLVLILFALFYLLPFGIMLINSLKPLSEITGGNIVALPRDWTLQPWRDAWSTAQIGVEPTGLRPYFINSILMAVPAVAISTIVGAFNGYVLTKWRFRGDTLVFGLILFSCFIPFQIVLIPMARILGLLNVAGTTSGLILVHVVYGIGFTTLYFRNYYAAFPTELIRAAQIDGAKFFSNLLAHFIAQLRPYHCRFMHLAIHQYLERFFVWGLVCLWRGGTNDGGVKQPGQFLHWGAGV